MIIIYNIRCLLGHQGGAGGRHHDCGGHGGAGQGGDPHGGLRQVAQVGRRQGEGVVIVLVHGQSFTLGCVPMAP